MENHKGKSVPIVKEFEIDGAWMPMTPMKTRLGPIYENGEVENYLSRFSRPNDNAQTLLSYSITSAEANNGGNCIPSSNNIHLHHLWDDGRINLERENVEEMQRRGLEEYLPTLNSLGGSRMVYPSTNPAQAAAAKSSCSSYPDLNSWEASLQWKHNNGVQDGGSAAATATLDQYNMSYANLLARGDTSGLGMGNAAVFPSLDSNQHLGYNSNGYGNSMFRSLFGGEMQSCASPDKYQSIYDASSSQTFLLLRRKWPRK